jgi:hypothetical protein
MSVPCQIKIIINKNTKDLPFYQVISRGDDKNVSEKGGGMCYFFKA